MPSERVAKCFRDALHAIGLIRQWVAEAGGADAAIFKDAKTRSAIERQLLVLSEAAIRLDKLDPGIAARLAPGVDWSGVRGIGNFIRHKYDDLDTTVIVEVIRNRLDEIRIACEAALRS